MAKTPLFFSHDGKTRKYKSKGLEGFCSTGGFSRPQILIQKLEKFEAT